MTESSLQKNIHQEKPNAECDTCKRKFIFRGRNLDRLKKGEWFYCPSFLDCSGKVRLLEAQKVG